MKKSFLLLAPLLVLLVQEVSPTEEIKLDDFSYTKKQVALAEEVVKILEEDHFLKKSFDSVQIEAFDLYLERLDPNKNIFLSRIPDFMQPINSLFDRTCRINA